MLDISQEAYQIYLKKATVVLKETSQQLKIQADKATDDLSLIAKELSQDGKLYLSSAAENSPEPVKDIVETFASSNPDDLKDVSKVLDFYVGIPYGMIMYLFCYLYSTLVRCIQTLLCFQVACLLWVVSFPSWLPAASLLLDLVLFLVEFFWASLPIVYDHGKKGNLLLLLWKARQVGVLIYLLYLFDKCVCVCVWITLNIFNPRNSSFDEYLKPRVWLKKIVFSLHKMLKVGHIIATANSYVLCL